MNGHSPFAAAARAPQHDRAAADGVSADAREQREDLRTLSGGETTSSAVVTQPRESSELKSFGQHSQPRATRKTSEGSEAASGATPRSEPSDAIRRFSSAGSQVLAMVAVVNRFQELRRLAGEAYIDPSCLTRVRDLGEGAFAKVVQCRLRQGEGQPELDVAVKLLKPALFTSDLDVSDFVKEGIVLKRMRHPSVVRVVGLGFKSVDSGRSASPDSLFIVQELCGGGALRDLVASQMFRPREIVYTYEDGIRWAMQITAGLAHLHAASPRIIHRDLKLDNVLLTGDSAAYDAKIADFGLHATVEATARNESVRKLQRMSTTVTQEERSRLADHSVERTLDSTMIHMPASRPKGPSRAVSFATQHVDEQVENSNPSLMQRFFTLRKKVKPRHDLTGQTGSFLNMAPEVVLGERYNEAADLFSLAIVLYEIFTKTITAASVIVLGTPHECCDYAFKVARGYRMPCPMSWPRELSELIQECWAQDPDLRPSAAEALERLRAIQASGAIRQMDADEQAALRKQSGGGCCFRGASARR